jgi:hypothetical protein
MPVEGNSGTVMTAAFLEGASFSIPGLKGFSQPLTLVLPVKDLSARLGHDFDGIIGADFISQFVVEVDYQARVLRLHDRDKFKYTGIGEIVPIHLDSCRRWADYHPVRARHRFRRHAGIGARLRR